MRGKGFIAATTLAGVITSSAVAGPGDRPPMPNPNIQLQFGGLTFRIRTGGDDLRSDSEAWIELRFKDGSNQKCQLKDVFQDTWDNNSLHEPPACTLSPARSMTDLKTATIVLRYDGSAFPTDPFVTVFHTVDNWDVREVHITALSLSDKTPVCLLDQSGNPLVRLTGDQPGMLLTPSVGCH
jgi:hypothetical protein